MFKIPIFKIPFVDCWLYCRGIECRNCWQGGGLNSESEVTCFVGGRSEVTCFESGRIYVDRTWCVRSIGFGRVIII